MKRSRRRIVRKSTAFLLSMTMMVGSAFPAMATNSYVTDNTEEVMNNASSEGGGMVYNLPAPTEAEFKALKEKYTAEGLYDKPESAGETEYDGIYSRDLLEPMEDEEIEPIVNALVNTMTFEEKLALIADPGWGAEKVEKGQAMYLPGVPRLGVPVVRQHDGPAGVSTDSDHVTTNLPTQTVVGNTFSTEIASDYGSVIGKELVSIGSNWELGAQFDLTRDIRWKRAKDTFGEDYYLTGELAVAETAGMQSQGAGAEAKHIGAYATGGDGQLWTFVDEQTLHTAYLYTFEQPAKRANLGEVMTTYTRLNGYYTFSNEYLLKTVLRDMWNWKGGTVTDAMSSTEFNTPMGLDSEMGKSYNVEKNVLLYMDKGYFTEEQLDEAAGHMLWSMGYAGYLGMVEIDAEKGLAYEDPRRELTDHENIRYIMDGTDVSEGGDRAVIELSDTWEEDYENGLYEDNNKVALETAEKGIVLLKNEGQVLPLQESDYTGGNKVALIGWPSDNIISGTGSERSAGNLDFMTTPYEAMLEYVLDHDSYDEPINVKTAVASSSNAVRKASASNADREAVSKSEKATASNADRKETVVTQKTQAINAYVLNDTYGTDIPQEYISTVASASNASPANASKAGENGWIHTGKDADGDEIDEIAAEINYLTTYENNKNSFRNLADGKAFKNGETHTWKGYLTVPDGEDGTYQLVVQTLGGEAKMTIKSLDGSIIGKESSGGGGGFPGAGGGGSSSLKESDTLSASASGTLPNDDFTKEGLNTASVSADLKGGKTYEITVNSTADSDVYDQQVRLAWITPDAEEKAEAEALAAAEEEGTTVVYFVRVGPTGHGGDNQEAEDLYMYDDDQEMLKKLQNKCKANGNKLIVVTYSRSGFAFDGDWADDCDAIVAAFYPGQAGGQALANILMGVTNPSGRLSVTMPKTYKETLLYFDPDWDTNGNGKYDEGESYEDYLAWQRYGKGGAVYYKNESGSSVEYYAQYNEGLNFGYRWYDMEEIEPEYAFGYGLSYTDFEYSDFEINETGNEEYPLEASVTVTNTGSMTGSDVVQLYAGEAPGVPETVQTTKKQLVAFGRTDDLEPGEETVVTMSISRQMLSYWDASLDLIEREDGTKDKWILASGERDFMVLTSAADEGDEELKLTVMISDDDTDDPNGGTDDPNDGNDDHGNSSSSGSSGSSASGTYTAGGSWQKNSTGWWYKNADGSYAKQEWKYINNKWYYFNEAGYMAVGWQVINDKWYYLDPVNGDMKEGWNQDSQDGRWYYLNPNSGDMAVGWKMINDEWYYFSETVSERTAWNYDAASGSWLVADMEIRPYGSMYAGEMTPDGHMVNENGARVE